MDKVEQFNYLMFENDQNSCWLDASIVLIAHSTSFKNVETFPESQIKNIISTYNEALAILNDNSNSQIQQRIEKTRKMLRNIQKSTLHYLEKFLKFKQGEPESAFCALLNLIYHDNSKIKENTSISWIWQKNCDNCGIISKSNLITKPIITLPKVNNFNPECPTSAYICSCKKEQEMKLIYKELPNILIFHFEKGAGKGSNIPLSFSIDVREYHLTGVVMLEKSSDPSVNHFVTWIRNPVKNMWLDCNDLNTCIVKFTEYNPELELKDMYMCLYEAFDDLGKISHELSADEEPTENVNAELIDLSDEGKDLKNISNQSIKNEETHLDNYSANLENVANYSENNLHNSDLIDDNGECSTSATRQTLKMSYAEKSNDVAKPDIINHENHSINSDKCTPTLEFPDINRHKREVDSNSYKNKSVIFNVSEVKTETGDAHANGILSTLNQKNEIPCTETFVGEKDKIKVPFHKMQTNTYEVKSADLEATQRKNSRSDSLSSQIMKTQIENVVSPQNDKNLLLEKTKTPTDKVTKGNGKCDSNELAPEKKMPDTDESLSSMQIELNEKRKTRKKKQKTENLTIKTKTNGVENNVKDIQRKSNLSEANAKRLRILVDNAVETVFANFHMYYSPLRKSS